MGFNKYDNNNSPQKEFVPDYANDFYGYQEKYNGYENGYPNTGYENGYSNTGYENSYPNTGYENSYPNTGYENSYPNTGYENSYPNTGYENGYPNTGYENGYSNTGYENGYPNTGYENSYPNTGYESGYSNTGYENSYPNTNYENTPSNTDYENGYSNTDYDNDFLDDYINDYDYQTDDVMQEIGEDYGSFINSYEDNNHGQAINDTQQLLEEYEKPAPKRKPPSKPKVLWGRVFFALFVVIIALLLCIFLLGKIISGVAGLFFKQTPKEKIENSTSVVAVDDSINNSEISEPVASSTPEQPATSGNYMYDQLVILLDAGHGGNDDGAVLEPENSGDPIRKEKDDNLEICQKIKLYLEGMNVKVIMTRDDDTYVSPGDRCRLANDQQVDFLVSVHRNSYSEPMQGVEVWIHNERPQNDMELANHIMYYLEKTGKVVNSKGVQHGYRDMNVANNFMVNASSKMPSCLIELGYITDKNDNHLFDTYTDDYALAIATGIFEAAKNLKVVDEDGKRVMNEQLSTNKHIYPIDDDAGYE